ncbi:hypothetical protein L7F22_054966 [Adiantum nelumboides]|nr:hypothetical protein [Adiantum nelumboides]
MHSTATSSSILHLPHELVLSYTCFPDSGSPLPISPLSGEGSMELQAALRNGLTQTQNDRPSINGLLFSSHSTNGAPLAVPLHPTTTMVGFALTGSSTGFFSAPPTVQPLVLPQRPQGMGAHANTVAGPSVGVLFPLSIVHQNALPPVGTFLPCTSTFFDANHLFLLNDEIIYDKGENLSRAHTLSPKGPLPSEPTDNADSNQAKGKHPISGQNPTPETSGYQESSSLTGITMPSQDLAVWQQQLQQRVVVGLCHGIRPPLDTLKSWMYGQWESRDIRA